jgi:tRNA-Thr(GGU) m(6)t(6)A37 methyltransferase TsaA
MDDFITFKPAGVVRRNEKYRFETPRQGVFAGGRAFVEIADRNFWKDASRDLDGFERIWLIGVFHLNLQHRAKALVHPPVAPEKRGYGVFATRSPHRPNPVALSCVRLLQVTDSGLLVDECDLLDDTPILDIKPYIADADAFPDAFCGWRSGMQSTVFAVSCSSQATEKTDFLLRHGGIDLAGFVRVQLSTDPENSRRKRIRKLSGDTLELAWRTWRIKYKCRKKEAEVEIIDIYSGYSIPELAPDSPDIYNDKDLHRLFCSVFERSDP